MFCVSSRVCCVREWKLSLKASSSSSISFRKRERREKREGNESKIDLNRKFTARSLNDWIHFIHKQELKLNLSSYVFSFSLLCFRSLFRRVFHMKITKKFIFYDSHTQIIRNLEMNCKSNENFSSSSSSSCFYEVQKKSST